MVKVFTDEIPRVPISAFTDLDLDPREYQVHAQDPLISQLQDIVAICNQTLNLGQCTDACEENCHR